MGREEAVIGGRIRAVGGLAEEAEEVGLRRQVFHRCELQTVERDMRLVEIDGVDMGRRAGQVGKHVAAARRDGHNAVAFEQVHRLDVDLRVLPDLRIDEAGEQKRKQPFGEARPGKRPVLVHGLAELTVRAKAKLARKVGHIRRISPCVYSASVYRDGVTGT